MTHYAALSEALTRATNTPGQPLIFRGTDVHLCDFIDQYEHISHDRFLEQHSGVRAEQIRIVSELFADILMDAESTDDAWRQLRQQADWALLSEAVSREIERGPVELSDPPTGREFIELVRRGSIDIDAETARETPESDAEAVERRQVLCNADADSDPARMASDQLNDACIRLEQAVALLARASRPALSAYTQDLINRLEQVMREVREGRVGS